MRGVHGLGFLLAPTRVFSLSIRPLVNAALYLLQKNIHIQYLSRMQLVKAAITTVSIRAMIGIGIGEKCS
jgi:hypothetical protein